MFKSVWSMCALASVALLCIASATVVSGEAPAGRRDTRAKSPPEPEGARPANGPAVALRVYEWGVDRANWDGTPVSTNDVPDFYYSADEVALGAAPEVPKPAPPPKPPVEPVPCAKPVVYFEADTDLTFNLEVRFAPGTIDWMYPKPHRRANAATAQWDGVRLYADGVKRPASTRLPGLRDVPKDHWANYSREGAKSTLVVNGEAERFIFYEGTKFDLPEADVSHDAEGNIMVRNFGCQPIHDVRLRLPVNKAWRAWYVREIAAANGGNPTVVKLTDAHGVSLADVRQGGVLAAEARAAGLTDTQAAVFERCWREEFLMGDNAVLTYRHDQRLVDETVPLVFTSTSNLSVTTHRVAYFWLNGIDLSRQAEMDKLADALSGGDGEAGAKLAKLGLAGVGAVRRLMSDISQSLPRRLKLAKWLKDNSKN